jgi:hypothetical protein
MWQMLHLHNARPSNAAMQQVHGKHGGLPGFAPGFCAV